MGLPLRYNYRNLLRRKLRTALTALGIGLVIATAVIMMAYSRGLLYSARHNGEADNVMVLSRRATNYVASSIASGELGVLLGLVADDAARTVPAPGTDEYPLTMVAPYVNHTFLVHIQGVEGGRYGERKLGIVKGVDPDLAFAMSDRLTFAQGHRFTDDEPQGVVVGALTWARLGVEPQDLHVGSVLEFGGRSWPVVGVLAPSGTSADGELWVPIDALMTLLNRTAYSYVLIKGRDAASAERIAQLVNRTDQTELRAVAEVDYYRGFAESFRTFAIVGVAMALIITLGGLLVGMNTMYTAISGRVREIGLLQVIGFSKRAILVSFLVESLWIALVGGAVGCALGALVNGMPMKISMGVFVLRVDLMVVGAGLGLAALIGVLGALVPARRALRLGKVEAIRSV